MKVRKKFPSKVACVHCNGGCRANQSPEGYDLCLYGCTGCGACMEVCRFGAISLNSYGVAEVDESRCIGCGACHEACPWHMPTVNPETGKSSKCIACGACVAGCPSGALSIVDWDAVTSAAQAAYMDL